MKNGNFEKILNSKLELDSDGSVASIENSQYESDEDGNKTISPCPENIVALDCEMVGVGKAKKSSLARCSIVDYFGKVLYDRYVKPHRKVTDYRTQWSGIVPENLENALPFKMARSQIARILCNKIVVGHALHFDMKILKLRLPKEKLRDTATYTSLRRRADIKEKHIPSLRELSKALLFRDIQHQTHCSVEDALAAMDLYRMVQEEWEKPQKSIYFNDSFWPDID